jgi:cardiolipin-specific phospholipase
VPDLSSLSFNLIFLVDGDHDWMDPEGGEQSVENLRKAGNGQARSYIVNNAGHHVYLGKSYLSANTTKELRRIPRQPQSRQRPHA